MLEKKIITYNQFVRLIKPFIFHVKKQLLFKLFLEILRVIPYRFRKKIFAYKSIRTRDFLSFFTEKDRLYNIRITRGPLKNAIIRALGNREEQFWIGVHEPDIQEFMSKKCYDKEILIDVGGCVGYYSLLFLKITHNHGKVFTFEPEEINIKRIKEIIKLNATTNIVLIELPIADEEKDVYMVKNTNPFEIDNSAIVTDPNGTNYNLVKKRSTTLDKFYADFINEVRGKKNLIKIDIEGFEYEALLGGKKFIQAEKPEIILELHVSAINKAYDLYDLITNFGIYNIYNIEAKKYVKDRETFKKSHIQKPQAHLYLRFNSRSLSL